MSLPQFKNLANPLSGSLQSRNIYIHGRRTSIRLEPEMWAALLEISALEKCTTKDLCSTVYEMKSPEATFTAATRVFIMEYFRMRAHRAEKEYA